MLYLKFMHVAVIGGDFRSCMIAKRLLNKGNNVYLFCADKSLGGFLKGVKAFDRNLDVGPQYLNNFTNADREFIESFGKGAELIDLTFNYSNFIGGKVSQENMALPNWQNFLNLETRLEILLERSILLLNNNEIFNEELSLSEYLYRTAGNTLKSYMDKICYKFYGITTSDINYKANEIIPFVSNRQALFEGKTSKELKKALNIFDDTLAAPRSDSENLVYNLYPKYGYSNMFETIESNLTKEGVKILKETIVKSIKNEANNYYYIESNQTSINDIPFDKIYLGLDERYAERILLGTNQLEKQTNYIPQHFIYMETNKGAIGNLNYIFDYDLNHITSRISDLNYSINNPMKTVLCSEVYAKNNNSLDKVINMCKDEISEISNQITNNSKHLDFYEVKSFTIPKCYRIPLKGYFKSLKVIKNNIKNKYGEKLVMFPFKFSRKEMLMSIDKELG
ncbi:hypothetical protein [Prochlorococcus marinus]|uniref:hypothetical protein n=1 Tax=Prochlorococcus marinus TaxID=1219 RepID=UPI0022B316EB|nr:hypothetical protein [Prochlorococcus marinus]